METQRKLQAHGREANIAGIGRRHGEAAVAASSSAHVFLVALSKGNTGIRQKHFRTQKKLLAAHKRERNPLLEAN